MNIEHLDYGQAPKLSVNQAVDYLARRQDSEIGFHTSEHYHYKNHVGQVYHTQIYSGTLGNNGNINFVLFTGDTQVNINTDSVSEGNALLEIYASPTLTTTGTAVTPVNTNRSYSENAPQVQIKANSVIANPGTQLELNYIAGGSGGASNGGSVEANEWLLKPNTAYLFRLTNIAGTAKNNILSILFYED